MLSTDAAALRALADRSLAIIRAGQAPTGAYLASPTFPVYRYSWFRDGAFIADAMSRSGDVASAEAFFAWCAAVLVERRERVDAIIARHAAGEAIDASEFLHTRYTADRQEAGDAWWNFQLDGYGAWLWALGQHVRRHHRSIAPFAAGALISARYVAAFWDVPGYDWWEEHPDEQHTSTLAAIWAGLRAVAAADELPRSEREAAGLAAGAIRVRILAEAVRVGHFTKWLGTDAVDASLIACSTPFGLVTPDDPLMAATIERIEVSLVQGGGVHRYVGDTYYGGGEWLLLAALLGWHYLATGRIDDAWGQLRWVATHATQDGDLPEQVADHLLAPESREPWLDRWGPVATPLLWSHAMYVTLATELGVAQTPLDGGDA